MVGGSHSTLQEEKILSNQSINDTTQLHYWKSVKRKTFIADFRSLITLVNSTYIFQILAGFSLALALVSMLLLSVLDKYSIWTAGSKLSYRHPFPGFMVYWVITAIYISWVHKMNLFWMLACTGITGILSFPRKRGSRRSVPFDRAQYIGQ
jgi:hypothetical protein